MDRHNLRTLFRDTLRWFLLYFVAPIIRLLPRNEQTWVFGSGHGKQFSDNSKYLFLHSVQNYNEIDCIWVSRDKNIRNALRERGYTSYSPRSLRGVAAIARAEYIFLSYGKYDVSPWLSVGATIIQLWHGNALKKIIYDDRKIERTDKFTRFKHDYDILNVTSEGEPEKIMSRSFGMHKNNIIHCGYPRNDVLYNNPDDVDIGLDTNYYNKILDIDEPLIGYIPTWRGDEFPEELSPFHEGNFSFKEMDEFLVHKDAYLIIKPHPKSSLPQQALNSERIIVLPKEFDIYPILNELDILITDYSSIYFDYLHVDNPVIFYPYDLDTYTSKRGLYYQYGNVTPGPISTSFDSLLRKISDTMGGKDEFSSERHQLRNRFYSHTDGGSSHRVTQEVLDLNTD